jgi:uncharacterized lipoprotein YmbA
MKTHPPHRAFTLAWTAALAALCLAGCASAPSDKEVNAYVTVPMADAEIMPKQEEMKANTKVVVVDAADGDDRLAQTGKLGTHLTRQVEDLLAKRGIEVMDDALAPKLDEELRKAEALNNGKSEGYTGPKVAKYALKPQITLSNYAAVYKQGRQLTGKLELLGALMNSAPGYEHSASVKAVVRVFELPTLKLIAAINLEGSANQSDARQGANDRLGEALLKDAATDAVRKGSAELLNVFAAQGQVLQRRLNAEKKQSVFQVSIGKTDGLKAGDTVEFFSQRPADNGGAASSPSIETVNVAKGEVSSMLLQDGTAWVVLDNEDLATRIRRGDLVKLKHTRSLLGEMGLPSFLKP